MNLSCKKKGFIAKSLILAVAASLSSVAGAIAGTAPELADDTVLVLLAKHADRQKIKGHLKSEANATTLKDFHVEGQDYSILQVRGASSAKIKSMSAQHPEILSASPNYKYKPVFQWPVPPDDPIFPQQWPLTAMRWTQAQASYQDVQQRPATMTIISSGVNPYYVKDELGKYVHQYNALGSVFFPEPPFGTDVEGDLDASITGCLTDNAVQLAGSGNFSRKNPTYITMLRAAQPGFITYDGIINSLVFCINYQNKRKGPGPINLSYGSGFPNTPLWTDTTIQTLAGTLLNQGDILVVSAGDTPGTYTGADAVTGNVVVAQGTLPDNSFWSAVLTQVDGDPVAAPGYYAPALINGTVQSVGGTSESAPLWCSAIAMLRSINPSLSCAQCHNIIVNTGTPVVGAPYTAVIPAFDKAIQGTP